MPRMQDARRTHVVVGPSAGTATAAPTAPAAKPATPPAAIVTTPPSTANYATAEILRLKKVINRSFYEVGYWLKRVRDEKLYEGNRPNFEKYLLEDVEFTIPYAYSLIRIAERLPWDLATAMGVKKSIAVVCYLDATPAQESREQILALQIAVRRNGSSSLVPVTEATEKEIRAAIADMRGPAAKRKRKIDASKFMTKAQPALQQAGIPIRSDGQSVWFGPVPIEMLIEFSTLLKGILSAR